jgi:lipopolysaccharide transport system permease protein
MATDALLATERPSPSNSVGLVTLLRMYMRDRFMGSFLGPVWIVVNPILMMGIFTFVFGFVFKARLPGADTSISYVIWLLSGYGPWLAIAETLVSSTGAVVASRGLLKNMAMRAERLPMAAGLLGVFPLLIAIVFVLALRLVAGDGIPLAIVALPIVIGIHFLLVTAIGVFLSAVNVFFRDLLLALPNLLMVVLFATPIFYGVESLPAPVRPLAFWNPFYLLADFYRTILVDGLFPMWSSLLGLAALAALLMVAARRQFARLERYFDSLL